jgi:carbamoyl-phosphate synthase large subunit
MTDPNTADRTYIEPLTCEMLEKVIAVEKPDAVLPTLGGQTALNLAMDLERRGILAKYGVEMIGAKADAIKRGDDAEDRTGYVSWTYRSEFRRSTRSAC